MEQDTAGDPITGLRWTRKTTEKVASELRALGIQVSARTVSRLLKAMDFSLRVNHKKRSHGSPQDRDAQFANIADLREDFAASGDPLISIDTKKKELVGSFRNAGRAWTSTPTIVNDHDFPSLAEGKAVPYGIYDLLANRATMFVGMSHDTPQFAVENVDKWWRQEGRDRYPHATRLGILADNGGSNGSRCRAWKYGLYHQVARRHGLPVSVAHYPPGTSKWNPIEHRVFSEISKNWAGEPLESFEKILKFIRTTRTSTGLRVRAQLVRKNYETGLKVSDFEMREICMENGSTLPAWNYTLLPG